MKIVCVCGLGMGSSLILKMTVEKAMQALDIPSEVEHQAAGTMSGGDSDLIVASPDFADELSGYDNVVFIRNIVSVDEAKDAVQAFLDKRDAS